MQNQLLCLFNYLWDVLAFVEGHLDGDGLEEFLADLDVDLGAGLGVFGARLAELAIPKDFNYDYREYESVVQNASSHEDAISRLKWRFDLNPQEAEFLLGLTIEEKRTYFIRENCEAEIARWEALRKVLAVQ